MKITMDKKKEFSQLVEKSISRDKENRQKPEVENKKESQATKLVSLVKNHNGIKLFHDDLGNSYAYIPISGHQEILNCGSMQFKQWLSRQYWMRYEIALSNESTRNALNVITSTAVFDSKEYSLSVRTARNGDAIWYDLSNPEWQCVKTTRDGWEIVNNPPILFKRFTHQQAQVIPQQDGSIKAFLDFINVKDGDHKLMLLVYIVSCFIPGFPHPALFIHGIQGSAKSTLSKLLRKLVDPSKIEVTEMPRSITELVQVLSHHWLLSFDNISTLSQEKSDILCKAITKTGFSKRELYTNDEDMIYSIQTCISLNGINLPATSPDLLERGFIIELDRIPPDKRRDERDLYQAFEEARPRILGGIFTALSQTLALIDQVNVKEKTRMSDFTTWGCAIAQALGYRQEEFLNAYRRNIEQQNMSILNDSPVAIALIELVEKETTWTGTPTELHVKLKEITIAQGMDIGQFSGFPKTANQLTKKINRLRPNLRDVGIEISERKENRQRIMKIESISQLEQDARETFGDNLAGDDENDRDDDSQPF